MKKSLKTLIALFLAFIFVLGVCSCASNAGETPKDTSADTSDAVTSVEDTLNMDVDYDGYTFGIYLSTQGPRTHNDFEYTDVSKVMDGAIFRKNAYMERTYNIVIDCEDEIGIGHGKEAYQKIYKQK